jgi:predicted outer membrane repeat protein
MVTREHRSYRPSRLVIWFFLVASADARIIYVDHSAAGRNNGESWADAFTNLSAALDKARAHDEVRVARGTYRPALPTADRQESFDLGKASGATIRGGYAGLGAPDPEVCAFEAYPTILSGDLRGDDEPGFRHDGENCYHVLTGRGTDPTTVLEGFTITGGHANSQSPEDQCGAGLYNEGGGLTIRDCHFLGNTCDDNGGAVFNKAGALRLIRCRFSDNRATNGGAVYSVDNSVHDYPVLFACRFSGNRADNCGGGLYHSNSHAELIGCAFYANRAADGGGVYNDRSGPDRPRQIWVAAGTYTPSAAGTRENASFSLVSNMAVYGGFAGSKAPLEERDPERYVTTLSGDLPHNDVNVADSCDLLDGPTRSDNCCHVVTGSETDATAVLEGFTITGGMATGVLSDASGGAIYIRSGSLTLHGCTFRANAATAGGGAIYCRLRAPKIRACTIRHDSAGKGGGRRRRRHAGARRGRTQHHGLQHHRQQRRRRRRRGRLPGTTGRGSRRLPASHPLHDPRQSRRGEERPRWPGPAARHVHHYRRFDALRQHAPRAVGGRRHHPDRRNRGDL